MHGLFEFLLIESTVTVIISNLELFVNAGDTSSSSLGKPLSEVCDKLLVRGISINISYLSLSGENSSVTSEQIGRELALLGGSSLLSPSPGVLTNS